MNFITLNEISFLLIIITISFFTSVLTIFLSQLIDIYFERREEKKFEEAEKKLLDLINEMFPGIFKTTEIIDLSNLPLPDKNEDIPP